MGIRFALAVALLATACGASHSENETTTSDPGIETLSAEPPWGLAAIALPDTAEAIGDVLDAMPAEVDGVQAEMRDGQTVMYGADERSFGINVLPLSDFQEFSGIPDMNTTDVLAQLVESGELESVEYQDLDSDGLVLLAATGMGNGVLQYTALWAGPEGEWLFTVVANTSEVEAELVHAFIGAVEMTGG